MLNCRTQAEGCWRGGEWSGGRARWMMGIKEGACCDEYSVLEVMNHEILLLKLIVHYVLTHLNLNKNLEH